jgi:hypothetical protein
VFYYSNVIIEDAMQAINIAQVKKKRQPKKEEEIVMENFKN